MRRAFTLPAMLCGTFGLVAPVLGVQPVCQVSPDDSAFEGPSGVATIEQQLKRLARAEQQAPLCTLATNPVFSAMSSTECQVPAASSLSCLATPVRRAHQQNTGAGDTLQASRPTKRHTSVVGEYLTPATRAKSPLTLQSTGPVPLKTSFVSINTHHRSVS